MEQSAIYKCNVCGNVVEVVHASFGELVCCGQPMQPMSENTVDASLEKHVPVVERVDGGFLVKVGSVPHPMEGKHYIMMIELIAGGISHKRLLKPGEAPEAFFPINAEKAYAREYCNLHGLWKSQ